MEEDDIYRNIRQAISSLPENFSILEEQIDVELQYEYFNFDRDFASGLLPDSIVRAIERLFETDTPISEKKKLLVFLASQDKVEAFRAIEKYVKNPDKELRAWSILAMQESRMVLQSSLLDEQQVYISTGLGGKGQKLRYFIVIIGKENAKEYTLTQQKLIKTELEFAISNTETEIEEITFYENFALIFMLIPLKEDIQNFLKNIISECNQYGDFISNNLLITNVKRLSIAEIKQFAAQTDSE